MIDLSIIVVNWNVRDLLKACLTSIYEHNDLEPGSWEVFVVDNHSVRLVLLREDLLCFPIFTFID